MLKKIIFLSLSICFAFSARSATLIAWVDLSTSSQGTNMYHFVKNDPNDEPYTYQTTIGGRTCYHIPAAKYGYFMVDANAVPSTMNNLIFKITYFDEGTGEMKLQYNGTTGDYVDATANKTNTGTWVTTTLAVTDASMRKAQNQSADFRISDNNYISRIEIYDGVLDPQQEPVFEHLGGSTYSEFIGKSVAGYQAWFDTGGKNDYWVHWGNGNVETDGTRWPRAYNHTFEIYPDITIYDDADLAQTGFADLGNGEPARLYTSQSQNVINTHFQLMKQTGLEGVAVQRFIGASLRSITSTESATPLKIRKAAEENERIFYICYDITSVGLENTWADLIKFDWVYNIEQNYQLTKSPAYATVNGKPVVQIWGTGFTDNHPGTAAETIDLIEFLRSRGCYVIGGVPTYWRENRNDAKGPSQPDPKNQESFEQVYKHYDMVSPWMVGRFSNEQEYLYFQTLLAEDVAYCKQINIDYMPVVFAGFGWATWNSGSLNQAPRQAGEFLWLQAKTAVKAGLKNIYFAMFDEYDEGTALLNAATDYTMLPTDAYFLTTSADGRWLSADFYLRLAGDATLMLQGKRSITDNVPIPYSLGPVYYRNSFEQRTTKYNYVNDIAQSEGTFPIDPCLYNNKEISAVNVANASVIMIKDNAHSGDYSAKMTLAANGEGRWAYQIAELNIPICEPLEITAYRRATGLGLNATIEIATRSGQTFRATANSEDDNYALQSIVLPAACIGDTISSLRLVWDGNGNGNGIVTAYFDDFLIESTNKTTDLQNAHASNSIGIYDLLGRRVSRTTTGNIYIEKTATEVKKIFR